jgi:hypothetical protein
MKLILDKKLYKHDFIYSYLKSFIFDLFKQLCDKRKLKLIDDEFNIHSYTALLVAFRLLKITNTSDSYVLSINKNLIIENHRLNTLIDMITYGNRSVKGYPIILKVFDIIKKNISYIYEDWLENGGSI